MANRAQTCRANNSTKSQLLLDYFAVAVHSDTIGVHGEWYTLEAVAYLFALHLRSTRFATSR